MQTAIKRLIRKASLIVVTFIAFSAPGLAQDNTTAQQVAIQGYSPVSYFEKGMAEKGDRQYAVTHKQKTYHLSSLAQVDLFKKNPDKYVPLFGEMCPYSLALGRRVPIDPTLFKIVGGRVLLFHQSAGINALDLWNKGSEPDLMEKAKHQWTLHKF